MEQRSKAIRPDEAPSEVIVRALAEATDRDPTELRPLYDVIEPDALNALLQGAGATSVEVQFAYEGYEVRADPSEIQVRALDG